VGLVGVPDYALRRWSLTRRRIAGSIRWQNPQPGFQKIASVRCA
jgi:hypothetical protein